MGSPGIEDVQFNFLNDIAIDLEGNAYIAYSDNNRIRVFRQT
jgi:hypothetical protein